MAKHNMMAHPEEEVVFSMKVLKQHRSAFERQVIEAVFIEMEDDGSLLNSKGGFNRCALPRLQVVIGDKPAENEERLTAFHDILTSQQTQGGKRKSLSKKTEDTSLPISLQKKKFKQDSVQNVRVERGKQKVRKKMDPNDRMKEAKAKARMKTKITKLNENKNIYPNFYFIPILKVFWVKTEADDSGSNDRGSKSGGYKRQPGFEGVAS